MKATDIVRQIMNDNKISISTLTTRLGMGKTNANANVITKRLTQDNISVDKLIEMLRVLDYKLVIVPNDSRISNSKGCYEITHSQIQNN